MYRIYQRIKNRRSVIKLLKRMIQWIPEGITPVFVWRRRVALSHRIHELTDGTIVRGPFKTMKLPEKSFWGDTDVAAQILGIYEQEVLQELQTSMDRSVLINLGAADGYYSIGWARLNSPEGTERTSIAFEIERSGREQIKLNARLNGVEDSVRITGIATKESLLELREKGKLDPRECVILSDIEGYEYKLIDADVFRAFAGAKWIIEAHEFDERMQGSLSKLLSLAAEHFDVVRVLTTGMRNPHSFEELRDMSDVDRYLICAEGRDGLPGKWLVFE